MRTIGPPKPRTCSHAVCGGHPGPRVAAVGAWAVPRAPCGCRGAWPVPRVPCGRRGGTHPHTHLHAHTHTYTHILSYTSFPTKVVQTMFDMMDTNKDAYEQLEKEKDELEELWKTEKDKLKVTQRVS